jgi:large subunit ribosomal protein LP2
MRHLAAYLLLVVGGNSAPTADDVKTVLASAGIETDDSRLSTLITELEGKSLAELIAEGSSKLLVGTGGGGGGGGAPAAGGAAAPAGGAAPAAVEEKPKEEEVDALDGGMDMFGGGGGGGGDY